MIKLLFSLSVLCVAATGKKRTISNYSSFFISVVAPCSLALRVSECVCIRNQEFSHAREGREREEEESKYKKINVSFPRLTDRRRRVQCMTIIFMTHTAQPEIKLLLNG
jgi:hypothetical protein